jgi:hypothetical protein
MESVEVRFGRGDKRRTLGWLEVGPDGYLRYRRVRPLTAWERDYNNLLRNGAY